MRATQSEGAPGLKVASGPCFGSICRLSSFFKEKTFDRGFPESLPRSSLFARLTMFTSTTPCVNSHSDLITDVEG